MSRGLSVVVPIRDAQGDRLAVARSFSMPGTPSGPSVPTVFAISAEGVIPIVSVGPPGLVGVITGINAEGIAIFVHVGRTADVEIPNRAQPAPLIARDVLERARTLDEAVKLIEQADILGAASFLVVDGKSRSHTIVERSPKHAGRPSNARVACGILAGKAFKEDPENDRARRTRPAGKRLARASRLARNVTDVSGLLALLRDRRNADDAPLPPGHLAAIDDPEAEQVVIVDASAMVLWVGEGPGATGPMRAIDLRYLLGRASSATAPPDLPAGPRADTESVLAANRDLRTALGLAHRGELLAASEAAARAVGRAPSYPTARRIAATLARRAGDREAAKRHVEAFLASPDLPGARDQLRERN